MDPLIEREPTAAQSTQRSAMETPNPSQNPPAADESQRLTSNYRSPWYMNITVEPTMFLYMFAFMITSVAEQDFFIQKACRVNNNFSDYICDHIKDIDNKKYQDQVQITTARFHLWSDIADHLVPIILALFMGAFSDRRGRKLPLLMGLCGKFIYSVMIVVNARMKTWPLEYVIYTAILPSAMTGADVAIFGACFAYITDVSSERNRTLRVSILDACYLSAMPSGVALGSYLFYKQFNQSYANLFTLNASLLALAVIYTLFVLKWQTTTRQRPLRELGCCGFFLEFFDIQHALESLQVLTKRRPGHRRSFLIILLIAMALYTFQRDEGKYLYMYTVFKFKWDIGVFSTFKTFKSTAFVLAMLVGVPLMNKVFGWRDTTIVLIGACAHAIARVFYLFATNGTLFYAGAVICSLGPVVAPMIRAMTSKIVPQSERGKAFALLSVCDNAVPLVSGICFYKVYEESLKTHGFGGDGSGVFFLIIATQMGVFLLALSIHIILGNRSLAVPEISETEAAIVQDAAVIASQRHTTQDEYTR